MRRGKGFKVRKVSNIVEVKHFVNLNYMITVDKD